MMDHSHRVPRSGCPVCGYLMDGASGITTPAAPNPGDVSICINCAAPLQFNEQLELERLPDKVLQEMEPDVHLELVRAQGAALLAKLKRLRRGRDA